ncbi:hypothetical protein NQ318_006068 [Aromia moschata]|uniref:Phosphotransferase n=1 Tax=Aromia moschata TaxID=1265417 RepID=A0AAV8Z4P2_9CUCU|nr:hypothetical protein NQ318_006068 [Aromia moschata]
MASGCKSQVCNPPIGIPGDPTGVSPEIVEGCRELSVSDDQLKQYMAILLDNINRGLAKDTHDSAIVKCFPTYVQDIPDGTERGKFLALDLGGSNFRVLFVELGDKPDMKHKLFQIPQSIMVGEGDKLFDFIAECLASYAGELGMKDQNLPLGFTFSFPLAQKGLQVGILEMWTKGFDCPDSVGKDVVQLLKDAIARRGDVTINVVAVLNDTTGTLVAGAYKNPATKIGLILGTGTNACYVEKQSAAELFDEPDRGSGKVLINTEWGAFGDDGALDFLRTDYDKTVDENSINPEVVRLAVERFTKEGLMFGGQGSDALFTREKFETRYVSDIEWDLVGDYTKVKEVCQKLGLTNATEQDYINLKYICSCFSIRAAFLVSAGLATLINKIGDNKIAIGIDGTLYKLHPKIRGLMNTKIKQLINPGVSFNLLLAEDGSGIGAALVAAKAASNC